MAGTGTRGKGQGELEWGRGQLGAPCLKEGGGCPVQLAHGHLLWLCDLVFAAKVENIKHTFYIPYKQRNIQT